MKSWVVLPPYPPGMPLDRRDCVSLEKQLGLHTYEATRLYNQEKVVFKALPIGHNLIISPYLDEVLLINELDSNYCMSYLEAHYRSNRATLICKLHEEGNLFEYVKNKILDDAAITALVKQCIECLRYIHEYRSEANPNGFVHRSVRPDRFLIDQGNMHISGFGLDLLRIASERYLSTRLTAQMRADTTSKNLYLAPEVATDLDSSRCASSRTKRADVYSLGVVIGWLITGEAPYSHLGKSQDLMLVTGGETSHDVSKANIVLKYMYHWCTKKCPEERPSCKQLLDLFKIGVKNSCQLQDTTVICHR